MRMKFRDHYPITHEIAAQTIWAAKNSLLLFIKLRRWQKLLHVHNKWKLFLNEFPRGGKNSSESPCKYFSRATQIPVHDKIFQKA